MEAQNKSGCQNEGEHNGSESEDSEDLDVNAVFFEVMREKRKEGGRGMSKI